MEVAGLFRFAYETDPGPLATWQRAGVVPELDPPSWRDNGFGSRAAMDAAHTALLAVLGPVPGDLVDLGCGDGALLARVPGGGARTGVEIDENRAARARRRHPEFDVITASIEDWAQIGVPHQLALVAVARLMEAPDLREFLPRMAQRTLVYTYEGGPARFVEEIGRS